MRTVVPDKIRLLRICNISVLAVCLVLCSSPQYRSQVPPHPRLYEKLSKGVIHLPTPNTPTPNAERITPNAERRTLNSERSTPNTQRSLNFLVVLVDFPDKVHSAPPEYFDSLLFSSSAEFSLKKYFSNISYGKMNFTTLKLPSELGWVRAPESYDYYTSGGNYGMGSYPNNAERLVEDIIAKIDPYVDFSKYDNDKDGYVDNIIIVHSGCGSEYSGNIRDIWSHYWIINSLKSNDGVYLSKYTICPEYFSDSKGDVTIGVFAHEFCHAYFGLADLYDSDNSSKGLGKWSLMSGGCWNGLSKVGGDMPAFPDAYSRIQMGFTSVQALKTNMHDLAVRPSESDSSQIFMAWGDGNYSGKEYFLIENRVKKSFDQCLPGEGLLVYHVDEGAMGNASEWYPGHTSSGHYRVSLIQADNKWDLEKNMNYGDTGDPYPGIQNNTGFSLLSAPDSRSYLRKDSKVSISNIRLSGDTVLTDINITMGYPGSLAVLSPNFRQRLLSGQDFTIQWVAASISRVSIQYSSNNGYSWNTIARNVESSQGNLLWKVPKINRSFCQVRVMDEAYPSYYAESGLFSIASEQNIEKPAEPGDLLFTQLLTGTYEGFELLAMNDLDISDLMIMNVPLNDKGEFSSNAVLVDISKMGLGNFNTVRKGTFIRFIKDKISGYGVDSTGKALIIYFPYINGPVLNVLSMRTAPLVVIRGTVQKPKIISGFDLAKSIVKQNNLFFRPNTFPGILPSEIMTNYWFKESITDFDTRIKNAIKTPDNWTASNTQLRILDKDITFSNIINAALDFTGDYFNNSVDIRWTMLEEKDNLGWQIERRTLNSDWANIEFISSRGDFFDPAGRVYSFTDRSITAPEVYYYRLKQINSDRTSNCSCNIKVSAVYSSSFTLQQNYPNPFNSSTSIKFSLPTASTVNLKIYNSIGQIVHERDLGIVSAGVNKTDINLNHMPSGVYFYSIKTVSLADQKTVIQSKKMVLIK